jgi:hypothetical protein
MVFQDACFSERAGIAGAHLMNRCGRIVARFHAPINAVTWAATDS